MCMRAAISACISISIKVNVLFYSLTALRTTRDSSSALSISATFDSHSPWLDKISIISSISFCAYATTRNVPPFGRNHDLMS